jgi:hypothetical protein
VGLQSANDRWQRVERIFHTALDLTGEERTAFITKECGADAVLRDEIESLLLHEPAAVEFLETPGYATPPPESLPSRFVRKGMAQHGADYLLHPRVLQAALVIPSILLIISFVENRNQTIAEIVKSHTAYLIWIAVAALGLRYRKRS